MTRLMNELINDEAVYRIVPATPGLLITVGPGLSQLTFEIVLSWCCNILQQ